MKTRKSSARPEILTIFKFHGPLSSAKLAALWNEDVQKTRVYARRYELLGYLEPTNPGLYPLERRLTAKGETLMADVSPPTAIQVESITAHALRTQPNSVWNLSMTHTGRV